MRELIGLVLWHLHAVLTFGATRLAMAEYQPHLVPGDDVSFTASVAVTGGQLVESTGNMTVGPAGALSTKVVGVAGRDAGGTNQQTTVPVYRVGVHDLTAVGNIAAGDKVVAGAAGTVSTVAAITTPTPGDEAATRAIIGTALEAIANTAKGRIALSIA